MIDRKNISSLILFICWLLFMYQIFNIESSTGAIVPALLFGSFSAIYIYFDYPYSDINKLKNKSFLYGARFGYVFCSILLVYIIVPLYLMAKHRSSKYNLKNNN